MFSLFNVSYGCFDGFKTSFGVRPMAAFALVLIILPYTISSAILEAAYYSSTKRANLRKDIIIFLAPALYVFFVRDKSLFFIEAADFVNGLQSLGWETGITIFIMLSILYLAIQFVKMAFLNLPGNANPLKIGLFCVAVFIVFIFCLNNASNSIGGWSPLAIFFSVGGVLSFVFLAGLNTVFAPLILLVNIGGMLASLAATGSILQKDYFIILDLIPEVPGVLGFVIVVGSTALAAYNYGADRGWFPPLPLFAD